MTSKNYYLTGCRLNKSQRERIESKGFYVYATRSWDEGCGCSLEKRVIVNHEDDVILNFKPEEIEPNIVCYDFYKWCDENEVYDDDKTFESVLPIVNE